MKKKHRNTRYAPALILGIPILLLLGGGYAVFTKSRERQQERLIRQIDITSLIDEARKGRHEWILRGKARELCLANPQIGDSDDCIQQLIGNARAVVYLETHKL